MPRKRMADVSGQTFGRLTVLELVHGYPRGRTWFKCRCTCGTIKDIPGWRLTTGHTISCGCARLDKSYHGGTKRPHGVAAFNTVYHYYRRNAKKRQFDFELTKEDCLNLFKQDCHYCGRSPFNETNRPKSNGNFTFNGIDRKDSKAGYSLTNCVPCCKECNHAKNTMTVQEFINLAKLIAMHHN